MSRKQTIIDVDGMTCSSCVRHVEGALRDIEGISAVKVELRNGKVVVDHDAAAPIETMIDALREAGFDSRPASS